MAHATAHYHHRPFEWTHFSNLTECLKLSGNRFTTVRGKPAPFACLPSSPACPSVFSALAQQQFQKTTPAAPPPQPLALAATGQEGETPTGLSQDQHRLRRHLRGERSQSDAPGTLRDTGDTQHPRTLSSSLNPGRGTVHTPPFHT